MLILGSHVSYGSDGLLGSAKLAYEFGANTFMFYTGAPQNTIRKPIDEEIIIRAHSFMKENGILLDYIVCHAPYIVNLANKKDLDKWHFSINFLRQELKRCMTMGIKNIVVHPGSAVSITKEAGILNIIEGLNEVVRDIDSVKILIETMAGKGSECGCNLEEIKSILDGVTEKEKFGVCLDTCHLHDAGYEMKDFSNFLKEFDEKIGISKIGCIHINDSKNERASHKDRHENFGFGTIGFDALLNICYSEELKNVPKILETPYVAEINSKEKSYPPYKFEIDMIKKKEFQEDLLEKIRDFYKKA